MTLTVGSLFSGIGGLDLGLERAGMKVIWQSEIDAYANRVLAKHWPEVVNHGNIKEINWEEIERPDVICGGYPCQPFSTAGRRRGEEDPRHLWPWVREAIVRLRPRYAILENVRGHLSLGGLSVIGELASIGYDCEWRVVSAASVGANHRRDRVIIIAYPQRQLANTNSERPHREKINATDRRLNAFSELASSGTDVANPTSQSSNGLVDNSRDSKQSESTAQSGNCCGAQNVADTYNAGSGTPQLGTDRNQTEIVQGRQEQPQSEPCRFCGAMANTNSVFMGKHRPPSHAGQEHCQWDNDRTRQIGYDGWTWWQVEPDVGRVAHGIPKRVDRLKGLGNAVVPQVAEVIGRLVVAHEATTR
jgi:DNA (cytosine-5)-methyltransferase 1